MGLRSRGVRSDAATAAPVTMSSWTDLALGSDTRKGHSFCTRRVILSRQEGLVERAGLLSSTKLDQLAAALRLAQVE